MAIHELTLPERLNEIADEVSHIANRIKAIMEDYPQVVDDKKTIVYKDMMNRTYEAFTAAEFDLSVLIRFITHKPTTQIAEGNGRLRPITNYEHYFLEQQLEYSERKKNGGILPERRM